MWIEKKLTKFTKKKWKSIIDGCHRYSPEKVKQHILDAMKRSKADTMFHGVEALKRAAEEGHPPLLRKGQIIFGTVSIASYKKAKGSFRGWIYNTLAPFLTLARVGQKRSFAYLHVAVSPEEQVIRLDVAVCVRLR